LEDLIAADAEILVLVKGFDDTFSNTVIARSSYRANEFVFGAKFQPMYYRDTKRGTTVIDMDKLNAYEKADISFSKMMKG
jgi:inward rectifier potassium channel